MRTRQLEPEWMDAADVDPDEHRQALAGLRRINRVSRVVPSLVQPLLAYARREQLTHLRLLDVASGGGDVPIEVAQRLRAQGIDVTLTLQDRHRIGLESAARKAQRLGIETHLSVGDATERLIDDGPPHDAVTCTLFLHHLDSESAVRVLANMKSACRGLLVVSDLVRSRFGLLSAVLGCHLLSRSRLVHHDGPASVRAAWTIREMHDLAQRAELHHPVVEACFPSRMRLCSDMSGVGT